MKLGLGSYACAWSIGVRGFEPAKPLDACGLIREAASLGLSLVQIADNIPLERHTRAELQSIRDTAEAAGVQVEVGTRGTQPDHLRRFVELCSFFRSAILRIVIDTESDTPGVPEIIDRLGRVMGELAAANITLALENHDRFEAQVFVDILRQVGMQRTGICLDTVNSFGALEGPAVVIDTLAPYVVSLHVKDFVIHRHASMMGFEITGAPAGQGRLHIPGLIEKLRLYGRDPNAILELWPPPEADVGATIAKERDWARQSVQYLRTLIPE